ncbi:MAG: major facilitator family transporter [Gammaproteobacteria bacterium]|jgi:MFS family permease|nr:major facilitator family transporter [Gammaproteobacteria bacterium]
MSTPAAMTFDQQRYSVEFGAKAWVIVFTCSLFFFYEFVQLNMFNALDAQLIATFQVDATRLGKLSAIYFLSNVLFLFPAGILLDRFSVRKLVLVTMGVCVFGTYLFALSTSFVMAETARFLTGIGSAFCFLSCIRLASRWLPERKMALAAGFIVTMGMLGGMVAQTPMTLLVAHVGWRHALVFNASAGVLFLILIALLIKDYPANLAKLYREQKNNQRQLGFLRTLKLAFINRQNWACGIYTALLNLPIFLLGAVWGMPYLTTVRHLSPTHASVVTSMLFLGTIVGSPLAGWLSDRLGLRRMPMIAGAAFTLLFICATLYIPHLGFQALLFLFLAIGVISSAQIISYPTVAESNPLFLTATAVSVVSLSCISAGGIFQYWFGRLMDWKWDGLVVEGMRVYSKTSFDIACLIMPIACVVSLIAALLVRETFCRLRDNV